MSPNDEYIAKKEQIAKNSAGKKSEPPKDPESRIPPGQRKVENMVAMAPIVHEYPHIPKPHWHLEISGEVEHAIKWSYEEFKHLPQKDFTVDFHCVTRWSKLDQQFSGVDLQTIFHLVKPTQRAKHVVFESTADGYSTNVSYQELLDHTAFIALLMDGEEIPDRYGGPARAVIPHLYGWKSCKHITGIRFLSEDERGFWEVRGYHNHADPWKEERYSEDEDSSL